jgi:hypothetical protein
MMAAMKSGPLKLIAVLVFLGLGVLVASALLPPDLFPQPALPSTPTPSVKLTDSTDGGTPAVSGPLFRRSQWAELWLNENVELEDGFYASETLLISSGGVSSKAAFVARFTSSGELSWVRTVRGGQHGPYVLPLPSGDVYFATSIASSPVEVQVEVQVEDQRWETIPEKAWFVIVRYGPRGELRWMRWLSSHAQLSAGVGASPDEGAHVWVDFTQHLTARPDAAQFTLDVPDRVRFGRLIIGERHFALLRYQRDGSLTFGKHIELDGGSLAPSKGTALRQGGLVIHGIGPVDSPVNDELSTHYPSFVAWLDDQGNISSFTPIKTENVSLDALREGPDGRIYARGSFVTNVELAPGHKLPYHGQQDLLLAAFDPDAGVVWSSTFGSSELDHRMGQLEVDDSIHWIGQLDGPTELVDGRGNQVTLMPPDAGSDSTHLHLRYGLDGTLLSSSFVPPSSKPSEDCCTRMSALKALSMDAGTLPTRILPGPFERWMASVMPEGLWLGVTREEQIPELLPKDTKQLERKDDPAWLLPAVDFPSAPERPSRALTTHRGVAMILELSFAHLRERPTRSSVRPVTFADEWAQMCFSDESAKAADELDLKMTNEAK